MTARRTAHLLAALLALCLVAPGAAHAQFDLPAPRPPAPAPAPDPVSPRDDGLEGWQQALVGVAGVGVLAAIAFFIVRDARRRAPRDTELPTPENLDRPSGSRPPKATHKQRRAKAKAARRSRRRNR